MWPAVGDHGDAQRREHSERARSVHSGVHAEQPKFEVRSTEGTSRIDARMCSQQPTQRLIPAQKQGNQLRKAIHTQADNNTQRPEHAQAPTRLIPTKQMDHNRNQIQSTDSDLCMQARKRGLRSQSCAHNKIKSLSVDRVVSPTARTHTTNTR
jgi:hypothetical protein